MLFWVLNNDANASNLTSANVNKMRCVIHKFCIWKGNSYKFIFNKVRHKNNCDHAFSARILHCASLVKPDCTMLIPKDGVRWSKLLVNLALGLCLKCAFLQNAGLLIQNSKYYKLCIFILHKKTKSFYSERPSFPSLKTSQTRRTGWQGSLSLIKRVYSKIKTD